MTSSELNTNAGSQEAQPRPTDSASSRPESSSGSSERKPAARKRLTEAEKADAVANLLRNGLRPEAGEAEAGRGSSGAEDPDGDSAGWSPESRRQRALPREEEGEGEGAQETLEGSGEAGPGEEGEDAGEEEGGKQEVSGPKTLAEAAERLGIEPAELYNLEISTGDGEAVKLGELKDAWQDRERAARETAERQVALDERETAIVAEQRLWAELGDQLSKTLQPGMRAQLQEKLEQRERDERRRMAQAMPEMQDPQRFSQFRDDAVKLLEDYGYKPHEIVIGDHRQMVILRDMMRLRKRLKELQNFKPRSEPPRSQKPQGRGPKPDKTAQIVNRGRAGSESDKVSAVAQLIKGS